MKSTYILVHHPNVKVKVIYHQPVRSPGLSGEILQVIRTGNSREKLVLWNYNYFKTDSPKATQTLL